MPCAHPDEILCVTVCLKVASEVSDLGFAVDNLSFAAALKDFKYLRFHSRNSYLREIIQAPIIA